MQYNKGVSAGFRLSAGFCVVAFLLAWLPGNGAAQSRKQEGKAVSVAAARDPKASRQEPTQQAPPEEPQIFPTYKIGTTEVMVPASVVGKGDKYLLHLGPENFTLYDNDVPQQIRVQPSELPLSMVVLIGNSGRVDTLLPEVRKTGIMFTDLLLGQEGEGAVVTFDDTVEVAQDFTRNSDQLQKAFTNIKTGSSGARLSDAMVRGLSMLAKRPAGRRKVIVVIAEDRNAGSETSLEYALREAQIGGVSVYSVGLSYKGALLRENPKPPAPGPYPPGVQAGPLPTQGGIAGQQTAGVTGGDFGKPIELLAGAIRDIFKRTPMEASAVITGSLHTSGMKKIAIENGIQEISNDLHSQYIISYRPSTLSQVGFHRIRVTVDVPGSEVRVPPGYFFAGPAAETAITPLSPAQPK